MGVFWALLQHPETETETESLGFDVRLDKTRRRARGRDAHCGTWQGFRRQYNPLFLSDPSVPHDPSQDSAYCSCPDNRDGRDSFLEYADEAHDEDYDRADLLNDDRRISDQRPEIVRLQSRISLEMLKECLLVGIVVRIYSELVSICL